MASIKHHGGSPQRKQLKSSSPPSRLSKHSALKKTELTTAQLSTSNHGASSFSAQVSRQHGGTADVVKSKRDRGATPPPAAGATEKRGGRLSSTDDKKRSKTDAAAAGVKYDEGVVSRADESVVREKQPGQKSNKSTTVLTPGGVTVPPSSSSSVRSASQERIRNKLLALAARDEPSPSPPPPPAVAHGETNKSKERVNKEGRKSPTSSRQRKSSVSLSQAFNWFTLLSSLLKIHSVPVFVHCGSSFVPFSASFHANYTHRLYNCYSNG